MTTICVDVMGSDCEPSVLLEGVAKALELDSELKVLRGRRRLMVEPLRARPRACRGPRYHRGHRYGRASRLRRAQEEGCEHRSRRLQRCAAASGRPLLRRLHRRRAHGCDLWHRARIKGIRRPALTLAAPASRARRLSFSTVAPTQTSSQTRLCSFAHGARLRAGGPWCRGAPAWRFPQRLGGHQGPEPALSYHKALAEGNCGWWATPRAQTFLGHLDVIGRWLHGQRCPEDH